MNLISHGSILGGGKNGRGTLGPPFVALVLALFLFCQPQPLLAADQQVQDGFGGVQVQAEDAADPAVQVEGQDAQVAGDSQDLLDLPEEEIPDMTFFDPDSIPDSDPMPNTTWVFRVPVEVSDLPDEVQRLGIYCNVFYTATDDFGDYWPSSCGEAKKRIDVVNGAVSEIAILGIEGEWIRNMSNWYAAPWLADKWECKMYLIGPDNSWNIPSTDVVHPAWRRADPGESFRWHAGPHSLPDEARVAEPENWRDQ